MIRASSLTKMILQAYDKATGLTEYIWGMEGIAWQTTVSPQTLSLLII
jgi:hypothetical protein